MATPSVASAIANSPLEQRRALHEPRRTATATPAEHARATMTSALRPLARLAQRLQGSPSSGRYVTTSCSGPAPPPAPPPCTPHPKPPCRSGPPKTVRALRVVCCPPPAGRRPPCPPRAPTAPRTCADLTTDTTKSRCSRACVSEDVSVSWSCSGVRNDCGADRDRVARRLAQAKAVRRADYEREAALPRPRAAPPVPHYRLGCERECARATDGRDYSVTGTCAGEPPARCGPARTPPPPRCVELLPDDACRIRTGAYLDPCAHRPRLLVHVDRRPPDPAPAGALAGAPAAPTPLSPDPRQPTCVPPTPTTLKSRIIQTLTHGRRPPDKSSIPTSADTKCHQGPQCGRRHLHTVPRSHIDMRTRTLSDRPSSKQSGALESVLREREALKEAGRGRAVCGSVAKTNEAEGGAGGQLELPVAAGVRRVTVRVALDACGPPAPRCARAASAPAVANSWLSIKNIHKKLSSCKRSESINTKSTGVPCEPKRGPTPAAPCGAPRSTPPCAPPATPAPPCPAPAPSAPSAPSAPCVPKTPCTEKEKKPKPLCRFLPLSLTASPIP